MKKVLILTAGYGEGHNAAARNLCAALGFVAAGTVETRVLDLLEIKYGRVNELMKKAYLAAIHRAPMVWDKIYEMIDSSGAIEDVLKRFAPLRNAMEALLAEEKPDVVVCTFPVYNCLIELLYEKEPRPFPLITVVTDSITINGIWVRCQSDAYVVANEETAAELGRLGIAAEKVHVLGFPVSPRFADLAHEEKQPPRGGRRWRVLYMAAGGRREELETAEKLADMEGLEVRIATGRNKEWQERMKAVAGGDHVDGAKVEVLGWTERMPELITGAHLLIGKAGGATVQEALAARTPMIITKVVPGQEEGNARLLLENGCGTLAETPTQIANAVESAFAGGGVLWLKWRNNGEHLSRPDAARAIAQFITLTAHDPSFCFRYRQRPASL